MAAALLACLALVAAGAPARHPRRAAPRRHEVIHHIVIQGRAAPPGAAVGGSAAAPVPARQARPGAAPPAGQGTQTSRQEQAARLAARTRQLEESVVRLQAALQAEREHVAALERRVEADRARWELQVEEPFRRAQALTAESHGLAWIDQALAEGSIDVGPAIAQAQARLAAVASDAGAGGSEDEASSAAAATQWLASSQDAMDRSDLYQARLALEAAALETQRALELAAATAEEPGSRY